MDINAVTGVVIDAAIRLHSRLGPGLLESVYESILAKDLERRGLYVERQKVISFDYEGLHFKAGLHRVVNNYSGPEVPPRLRVK